MRLLLLAALAITAAITAVGPAAAAPASPGAASPWAVSASNVCVIWNAKAQKLGSTKMSVPLLALKAKALESQELAVLTQIPGRTAAGTVALTAVKADLAEVGSAITAWNQGKAALFMTMFKRFLNDGRSSSALRVAGATRC